MNKELIKKAQELKSKGFATGEIADELNVSMDTAIWLTFQKVNERKTKDAPTDFAINWNNIGGNSARLRNVSNALANIVLKYEVDVILGVAISGIPFATMISDYLENHNRNTSLAIFHPKKQGSDEEHERIGAISKNFASVKGKKVVIVDDVVTSGGTLKDVISVVKQQGGIPIVATILIDKIGISEIDRVPVESLIKINRLG
ncbi:MAG: orotate phosphoribosyltransferase-like protein [Methanobrevibacter sp.]|jgi:orotate phosphoribosyltransferase|nr:orotate phosphoribosyltransferase-like protein [Candidatus Methanovirga aequatorialis]